MLIVTLLRILQGLFAGGEYGGAVSLMTEFAPRGKRGLYGAWQSFTVALGLLAGAGIVALLSALLTPEALHDWGWRIPFFLALPMGAVALWLRVSMEETPSFVQQKEKAVIAQASTSATLKTILMGIGRVMVWSAAGYTYLVIMPTYLQSALHTGFNQALLIAVISNIGFALTIIPSGMLSDRIGRRTVMIIATALLLILALPLLKLLQAESSTLAVKAVVVLIAGGLVGCLLSIPIIAIVAIPLKIESPGPLFFKQKRVGRNGRYFYIHKLRSMYMDAEERKKELMAQNEMNGLMFKMEDDPRVTKVGKFIRKTSIDELPQFFDVLRGDMSLVGTRPPTVDEYKQYESHHKRRLSMKPGITGLWQVSGRSNIEDFEEVVKLDVTYIDNWSLWNDIKILFKTVYVVFAGRGAK